MAVEHVHHFGVWSYFRKKGTDGPFDIYADFKDKIRYLSQINRLFIPACIVNILAAIMNVVNLFQHDESSKSLMIIIALNFLVAVMFYIAISKNSKRKKSLKEIQHGFES